jgi:hypothetical protein
VLKLGYCRRWSHLSYFYNVPYPAKKKEVEGFCARTRFGYPERTELAQMPERRRTVHSDTLQGRLAREAKRLREKAKKLKPGIDREALLRLARQAETGSRMSEWLSSPGLQPPR